MLARVGRGLLASVLLVAPLAALQAQDRSGETTVVDILADAEDLYGPPPPYEDCTAEQEAAILSGEIIVCRRKQDPREFQTMDRDSAQDRYARETMNKGNPQTPDVAGEGIFRGPATVSGLCVIPPCPKEAAIFIDVEALPEAPPGSDADRIARGLPPLGNDNAVAPATAEELGLPAAPSLLTGAQTRDAINPAGSEAPAETP